MLTEAQSSEVVRATIERTTGNDPGRARTLADAGVTVDNLSDLIEALVVDTDVGVQHFEHHLDPNLIVGRVNPNTTIDDLATQIMKLSAGKLCSNPNNPHEQTCCPYPTHCPQCGYAV